MHVEGPHPRCIKWTVRLIAFRICVTCCRQKLTVWPGKLILCKKNTSKSSIFVCTNLGYLTLEGPVLQMVDTRSTWGLPLKTWGVCRLCWSLALEAQSETLGPSKYSRPTIQSRSTTCRAAQDLVEQKGGERYLRSFDAVQTIHHSSVSISPIKFCCR